MFMSPAAYEKCFGKKMDTNAYVVTLADGSTTGTRAEAAKFMKLDGVLNCVQSTTLINQINVIVKSLSKIMLVLIVVAMLLALPVGRLLGWLLRHYSISAVPPENVMFDPSTGALSYIVSTLVVVAVVAVMYAVVNCRLKRPCPGRRCRPMGGICRVCSKKIG